MSPWSPGLQSPDYGLKTSLITWIHLTLPSKFFKKPMTTEQLKDLKTRVAALRRYL